MTATNLTRLGGQIGTELARWALEQWALRERGQGKFAAADQMLFTKQGLEMATHESIAAWHSSLFPNGVHLVDATCGLGADTIALARRGPTTGLDLDPETLALAEWNLAVHGLKADLVQSDCLEYLARYRPEYVFVDPARRAGGRKATRGEDYSPPLPALSELLQACKLAVLKLSPMLPDEVLEGLGGRLVFVSHQRECKEAVVVLGPGKGRSAVHVETGATLEAQILEEFADEPEDWLYEADPAAIRAHCLGAFGMAGLGDSNGYLTSGSGVDSVWLRRYKVLHHGPWHERQVRAWLTESGLRVDVVKTRGVELDPVAVKKQVATKTGEGVTLALWKSGARVWSAVLAPA